MAVLIPLVLVCDIAAFALSFWWYDLGLRLSSVVATLAPIVLLLIILVSIRFWPAASKTIGE